MICFKETNIYFQFLCYRNIIGKCSTMDIIPCINGQWKVAVAYFNKNLLYLSIVADNTTSEGIYARLPNSNTWNCTKLCLRCIIDFMKNVLVNRVIWKNKLQKI